MNHSLNIAYRINVYLHGLGWSQKDLADKMGKTEAEVSKWLAGKQNFTLKTISKIETVLGRDLIF